VGERCEERLAVPGEGGFATPTTFRYRTTPAAFKTFCLDFGRVVGDAGGREPHPGFPENPR
jgi:hypothetical protein